MNRTVDGMRHRAKVCWLVFALIAASKVAAADTVTLMWDMSADSQVAGYIVYAGTQSGIYTTNSDVGNTTSFVLSDAVPGQRYYFAASAYAADGVEGPRSAEISGFSNAPPALTNPGNQTSEVGEAITLQLVGSDPYGEPVSYKATGLPAGLSLTQSTGLITGVPVRAGTNTVTATVTDGVLSDSKTFTWSIVDDKSPPVVAITSPTSATRFTVKTRSLVLGGTATDNAGVVSVSWSNNRGGSGLATGTSTWTATIPLREKKNVITITARDKAGNLARRTITVSVEAVQSY